MRASSVQRRSGFSLVELLAALIVFAILASMALVKFRDMRDRAFVASMKTDLGSLRVAQEGFWAENQQYTVDQSLLDWTPSSSVTVTITTSDPVAGFEAEAVHSSSTTVCTMYVGRAPAATESGEIVCK